jgi:hypothetical protein
MSLVDRLDDSAALRQTSVPVRQPIPLVAERVSIRPAATRSTHLVGGDASSWGWREIQDFVTTEIANRHGRFPRNPVTEASIFKGFAARWSEPIVYLGTPMSEATAIARYAFGNRAESGMWMRAPISVNRFCVNSDARFAKVIVERLRDVAA